MAEKTLPWWGWFPQADVADDPTNVTTLEFRPPFPKNTVKLPTLMSKDEELNFACFKNEVMKTVEKEIKFVKKTDKYKRFSQEFSEK